MHLNAKCAIPCVTYIQFMTNLLSSGSFFSSVGITDMESSLFDFFIWDLCGYVSSKKRYSFVLYFDVVKCFEYYLNTCDATKKEARYWIRHTQVSGLKTRTATSFALKRVWFVRKFTPVIFHFLLKFDFYIMHRLIGLFSRFIFVLIHTTVTRLVERHALDILLRIVDPRSRYVSPP